MGKFMDLFFEPEMEKRSAETIVPAPIIQGENSALSLLFGNGGEAYSNLSISAVFGAVELISNSIAQLPMNVKKVKRDGSSDIVRNHPVKIALESGLLSEFTLVKQLVKDMYLEGAGYAYIKRTNNGVVSDIIYLEPGQCSPVYNAHTRELYYMVPSVSNKKIDPKNVIAILKNSVDGVTGKSVFDYAGRSVKLADAAEKAAKNYFSNGCNLQGVLSTGTAINDKQKALILANWNATYGGGNSGGIAVLGFGAKYDPILSNASDALLLETRIFNLSEIARYFCISPLLLQDLSHGALNNIEAVSIQFLQFTLMPVIKIIEHEFTRKLFIDTDLSKFTIDIDETSVLRADKQSESEYYTKLVNGGLMTTNEARIKLGLPKVKDGDTLRIPYTDIAQNTIGGQNGDNDQDQEQDKNSEENDSEIKENPENQ